MRVQTRLVLAVVIPGNRPEGDGLPVSTGVSGGLRYSTTFVIRVVDDATPG
jgi:hypothetical protein